MNDIVPFTGWTPERIDELKAFAAEGLTAAQIAFRMKPITELAVIGRASRLGIALGVKAVKPSRRPHAETDVVEEDDPMFGAAPPAREDAWLPLPGREPVQLLELNKDQCPWPIGDGGDVPTGCCGAPKGFGLPYCRDHTAMAYVGGRYHRARSFTAAFINSARRYAS